MQAEDLGLIVFRVLSWGFFVNVQEVQDSGTFSVRSPVDSLFTQSSIIAMKPVGLRKQKAPLANQIARFPVVAKIAGHANQPNQLVGVFGVMLNDLPLEGACFRKVLLTTKDANDSLEAWDVVGMGGHDFAVAGQGLGQKVTPILFHGPGKEVEGFLLARKMGHSLLGLE